MIYFVQGEDGGRIKIGFTTNLAERLSALGTGTGTKLVVLGVRDGDRSDEVALHRRFAAHRTIGEWFEPASDILSFVNSDTEPWVRPCIRRGRPRKYAPPRERDSSETNVLPRKYARQPGGIIIKCKKGYHAWVHEFAAELGVSVSNLIELAARSAAIVCGHPLPPSRLGTSEEDDDGGPPLGTDRSRKGLSDFFEKALAYYAHQQRFRPPPER